MNEHQKRLWESMIDMIQHSIDCQLCNFRAVVGELEGALDASGVTDRDIVSKWYDYWLPLEIRRVVEGDRFDKKKAAKELQAMQNYLFMVRQKNF